jgi:hypothetical protein
MFYAVITRDFKLWVFKTPTKKHLSDNVDPKVIFEEIYKMKVCYFVAFKICIAAF